MTRIIAGTAKGRRLEVPAVGTRPTSDRVRESMFSSLQAALGSFSTLRVLDLYAGSGALALEALSRGASSATAVERAAAATRVIERNARTSGLAVQVVTKPVARYLAAGTASPYDLVFLDPPYDATTDSVESDLAALVAGGWLSDQAVVVVERSTRSEPIAWPEGFGDTDDRIISETRVSRSVWYFA